MSAIYLKVKPLHEVDLWDKMQKSNSIMSFDLELTARCNNNCRHCYINLPLADRDAIRKELTFAEIDKITTEAVSMGALWCLVTGGEPLLRKDFTQIYLNLRQKGLLVSLFTNATLMNKDHIRLFEKHPPRDIEITVYGVTKTTYEIVTGTPGSFAMFMGGLKLLAESSIPYRLKAMALKENLHEMADIVDFCQERTSDFFRFDPFLSLRYDGNYLRNKDINEQRLSPNDITILERSDKNRFEILKKRCTHLTDHPEPEMISDRIFRCGIGNGNFILGWDGFFRLCAPLHHPDCVYDLRQGTLREAWDNFAPSIKNMRSESKSISACRTCSLTEFCFWCPAHAHLETKSLVRSVTLFCEQAEARYREALLEESV